MKSISNNVLQFANKRGLSQKTLTDLRIESGQGQYGKDKLESIVFGYYDSKGERVNYKARAIKEKIFKQQLEGKQQFYNLDNVLNSKNLDTVYITEGEFDLCALYESGFAIDSILSVPNGAPATSMGDPNTSRKYKYVLDGLQDGLEAVRCFVLLTDNDEQGLFLRADLAGLLGHGRCKFVDFPEDVKDPNEFMLKVGKEQLQWHIKEALQEFPIEGVYSFDEIPELAPISLYNPDFEGWDEKVMLGAGMVSVFTGMPGHGKTTFALQMWAQIVRKHDITIGMFSGETRVKPYVRRHLRTYYHKKLENELYPDQEKEADNWIRDHFLFLNHPNNAPEFSWMCERIRDMKARYGISAFILDPFNKLEMPSFSSGSETQFIGRCLDDLCTLAKLLDIHIMVLAHPSKPDSKLANSSPTAYSIAGSAHWYNKPDQIFSLWRPKFTNEDGTRCTDSHLTVWKTRYEELGYPRVMDMTYNISNGCFESSDKPQLYQSNRKDIHG